MWLHPDQLHANAWNPNVVPRDIYDKAKESLARYGWLSPVVIRHTDAPIAGFEIVDGEHRWQIAKEANIDPIPCFCIDGLSETDAKKATVILNDLHGQARPDKLSELFRGLLTEQSLDELKIALPYDDAVLASLLPEIELPSLSVGPLPVAAPPGQRWVERTYRASPEQFEVIDAAIARIRSTEGELSDVRALELMAADYLGK